MLSKQYFPVATEIDRVLEKYAVRAKTKRDAVTLIMPLLETRGSYIETVFAAIDEQHGSDAAFLSRACRLDGHQLARLRDLYTN